MCWILTHVWITCCQLSVVSCQSRALLRTDNWELCSQRHGVASTVTAKLAAAAPGSVALCSIVVGELHYCAHPSVRKSETLSQVQAFCRRFSSLTFDDPAAEEYGRIRAHLTAIGSVIGPNDPWISMCKDRKNWRRSRGFPAGNAEGAGALLIW
jgi:predicted nucleic acid-binding protein